MDKLLTIIDGCARHDRRHQQHLYDRFFGLCLSKAFSYVKTYDEAVDISHNALVKVFRYFDQFVVRDPMHVEAMLAGWIKKIVKCAALDHLRKQASIKNYHPVYTQVYDYPDESRSADNQVSYKDVLAFVGHLPPAYQRVFALYAIEGYSHPEIARMLRISKGASKSNLWKARAHLQRLIEDEGK